MPPEPLDAAIIYATVGDLVPLALEAVRKGGRVVCAGIHMSDIPSFPYRLLWEERQLVSVANLTRQNGLDFLRLAPEIGVVTKTTRYPLSQANQALADLRAGRFEGAAVLVPRAAINLGDPDARLIVTRSPPENARLLARGELPLGRADLSARQSSARIPAEARTYQTPFAGALGHDTGIELSLRPP
jgi:hypothetical protein